MLLKMNKHLHQQIFQHTQGTYLMFTLIFHQHYLMMNAALNDELLQYLSSNNICNLWLIFTLRDRI